MAKLVPDNDLEQEFTRLCVRHSAKLNEMWEAVKALSDETGLPVGPYVPESFQEKFVIPYDRNKSVDPALVVQLTGTTVDEAEFWYSSSENC